ncbi:lipoprotein [Billgrantia antri]|uniref:Lipoprotein n=1 Tax=Halomonas sulfidivorans TaxID=2733488 RepID=A0ABX7WKQ7_9GAMM|nr:lipoprotein [Halomonas sulfidivorans]
MRAARSSKVRTPALMALTLALLAGCGQKGPLYLPGDEAAEERYGNPAVQGDEQKDADDEDTD